MPAVDSGRRSARPAIVPALVLAAVSAVASFACKKDRPTASEAAPEEPASKMDEVAGAAGVSGDADPAEPKLVSAPPPGPTGTIAGTVKLAGTAPEMPLLQRGADAFCARKEMHAETVVTAESGALQNVLARIEPGAVPGWVPSRPVVVDQVDCMYRPRVQGGVRGQLLEVRNSDQTMHNVNARRIPWGERRDTETLFNRGQPAGSPPISGQIEANDILRLKCDTHGWMQGYVVVSDNPYFATTGSDGRFTIEKAPVGTYSVETWHEFYGIKSQKVTVKEGETVTVDFSYDAAKDRPAAAR